jgi:glc operon protein GlcG
MNSSFCLTGEDVEKIARAALKEANNNGWNPTLVIIDHSGELVFLHREPGKKPATVAAAIAKAKCVGGFGLPTRVWAERTSEHPNLQHLPSVMPLPGGVPLTYKGLNVGAIAVSGLTPDQDELVALAGANILLD